MRIAVINLASQTSRWFASKRQFDALGLEAIRHDAVDGSTLGVDQVRGLYCERLNAAQYHQPLRAGEIGCYASHIAVWQCLVESGDAAMAVFEDDLEIDADLPRVLEALTHVDVHADLVKLIGRSREQVRDSVALVEARPDRFVDAGSRLVTERRLISYWRVPSLTGAYVITREGAKKLLAKRRPFGRPVDVDLRHWWECGLRIRGVHPYPVCGAPSAELSTIGARIKTAGFDGRLKKIASQARYTVGNHLAVRSESAGASKKPVWASAPADAADARTTEARAAPTSPLPRTTRRRNLVVVRAGDASLHRQWLSAPTRDFDVFVSYYGSTPNQFRHDADLYEARPGPKWPCIGSLLQEHRELVGQYEAFWFPDDDLAVDSASIDRMFAFFCAYRLCLAQPALTLDSYYTWRTLLRDPRCHIRYSRFVEVMAPIFSRESLHVCMPTFSQSRSGWGLDWVWPTLCAENDLGRIAVIDATPVRHTRPVGGELYRNHPSMDGKADAARILQAYGIAEVRAVAKYSFEGQVRDVSTPLFERLLFWLKRLNGRRKHQAHA